MLVDFIRTKDPTFPLRLGIRRYIISWLLRIQGFLVTRQITASSKNLKKSQGDTLRQILRANAKTEYSQAHGLDKVNTREELRKVHPLCGYERFDPYYERMMNGEENILTAEKPLAFGITSGTTGKPSKIAVLHSTMDTFIKILIPFALFNCAGIIPDVLGRKRVK